MDSNPANPVYFYPKIPYPCALAFCRLLFACCPLPVSPKPPTTLSSPNGALQIAVETTPNLSWRLNLRGQPLLNTAAIALEIEGAGILGQQVKVRSTEKRTVNEVQRPPVHQKSAEIPERYNELTLHCDGDWGVRFRAYDEGVAYCFFTRFKNREPVTVVNETYHVQMANGKTVFFPEEESFYSHNERVCIPYAPADLNETKLASLPALLAAENGVKVLLTETDLQDYPGLWLRGAFGAKLRGVFPQYPKYTLETSDRDIKVTDREPFLARTSGQRSYPWRLFLVAERDADLLTNQMPWLLAEPSRLTETGWIRPGKVAWDWWNNLNITGVDFSRRYQHRHLQTLRRFRCRKRAELYHPRRRLVQPR
jgi:alpha-glucosidase